MAFGRYGVLLLALALAGSIAAKPKLPHTVGTFPTDGAAFVSLLLSVIFIVTGSQYFPSLVLGPVREEIDTQAVTRSLLNKTPADTPVQTSRATPP